VNYLFIHQNFPAQYQHIVRYLASQTDNQVYFLTQPNQNSMAGVHKVTYPRETRAHVSCHGYAVEIERAIATGATVAEACRRLRQQGFQPHLIVGHSGWGETLFVKDVFPDVPLLANFEFFYHSEGVDVGFDPEFVSIFNDPSRLRARNGTNLMAFHSADWGHCATHWQRSLYPADMHRRLTVLHEGIDTARACQNPKAVFKLPSGKTLTRRDEVITYVARNLEPYRGFHVFMRALPLLLRRRPRAHAVIVGGDGVSYGAPPSPRSTFRETMLQEVGSKLDLKRVHFLGLIEYKAYLSLLQISSAHVYLTYPFVLSWSLIEAMACGCLIIGSSTPPVLEVLRDGYNGILVDFFSHRQLANRIEAALGHREEMRELREAARATALAQFDLKRLMLPRWIALFEDLIEGRRPPLDLSATEGDGEGMPTRRASAPA
jgi:glycosyltransferase involved in cell wall biosynthesis